MRGGKVGKRAAIDQKRGGGRGNRGSGGLLGARFPQGAIEQSPA